MLRRFKLILASLTTAAFVTACGGGGNDPDIVQIAQSNPELSILVEAVGAAGLVDTLKGRGPYTVFAPTNAAFASLLSELGVSKEQLLADKALLTTVLTYHVVPGTVRAPTCHWARPSPRCRVVFSKWTQRARL